MGKTTTDIFDELYAAAAFVSGAGALLEKSEFLQQSDELLRAQELMAQAARMIDASMQKTATC